MKDANGQQTALTRGATRNGPRCSPRVDCSRNQGPVLVASNEGASSIPAQMFESVTRSACFPGQARWRRAGKPETHRGLVARDAGLEDAQEIRQAMLRTLSEVGVEVSADMSSEQLERASAVLAGRKQTTGFKVGERGLYVESRQVKAMLKESTNVLFGGERWGPTRKGPGPSWRSGFWSSRRGCGSEWTNPRAWSS